MNPSSAIALLSKKPGFSAWAIASCLVPPPARSATIIATQSAPVEHMLFHRLTTFSSLTKRDTANLPPSRRTAEDSRGSP